MTEEALANLNTEEAPDTSVFKLARILCFTPSRPARCCYT